MIPVWFNSINLDNISGVFLTKRLVHSIPLKAVNTMKLTNADGSKTISAFYNTREIVVEGIIGVASRALMETARDSLLAVLTGTEQVLELDQSGIRRKYTATVSNIVFSEAKGGYVTFTITFLCADPFGYDTRITEPSLAGAITVKDSQKSFSILGTYEALPLITVSVNSVTGGTSKQITISNARTGAGIYVSRTWVGNDVLVIDNFNKTVKVNGTAVNYTGKFMSFQPTTTELLNYSDTLATRSVTLLMSYYKRWL